MLIGFIGGSLVAPFLGGVHIVIIASFIFIFDCFFLLFARGHPIPKQVIFALVGIQFVVLAFVYGYFFKEVRPGFNGPFVGTTGPLQTTLYYIKYAFTNSVRSAVPEPYASFGISLLVGKEGIPYQIGEEMRKTGTTHLVALSGFNISLIGYYLFGALLLLRFHRHIALLVAGALIVCFVIMTGAEASLVRAAVMGELVLLAQFVGRLFSIKRAILCAAFGMILVDPNVAALDIGFQLSFLSTLGLVTLVPVFEKRFSNFWEDSFLNLRSHIFATIASQIMVFPILLGTFHSFSLLSFITNVLILPIIPVTMFVVFIVGVLGFFSVFVAQVVGFLVSFLVGYELGVIHLFSTIPFLVQVNLGSASLLFTLFYYSLLFIFLSHFWSMRTVRENKEKC